MATEGRCKLIVGSHSHVCLHCRATGVQSSFGEMLLLIATHFHGNHNNAVVDLVSATLGMKVAKNVFCVAAQIFVCIELVLLA